MSQIKKLKNDPKNNINLIDLIQRGLISDKTKYVELHIKLLQDHILNGLLKGIKNPDLKIHGDQTYDFSNLNETVKEIFGFFMRIYSPYLKFDEINNFIFYNERNLISDNDISKINSFEDLRQRINEAEIKYEHKRLEKETYKLYEDNEWLIIKPLTYYSSLKYGANTKWCTAAEKNEETFYNHAYHGMLIYIINKKINKKYAVHKYINKSHGLGERKIAFWDSEDNKVDSLILDIPSKIKLLIKEHVLTVNETNYHYCSSELKKIFDEKVSCEKECVEDWVEPTQENRPIAAFNEIREALTSTQVSAPMERKLRVPPDFIVRNSQENDEGY